LTLATEKARAAALATHMAVPTAGDSKESAMCIIIPPKNNIYNYAASAAQNAFRHYFMEKLQTQAYLLCIIELFGNFSF
jgi:hypothetical protein